MTWTNREAKPGAGERKKKGYLEEVVNRFV